MLTPLVQKLLLNFTWWVNRKDFDGKNVFEGGFLGLDNIGLFNRSVSSSRGSCPIANPVSRFVKCSGNRGYP